jgi:hypothetical protein
MSFWSAVSAVASKASEVLTTLGGEQYDDRARCHDRDGGEGQHAQQSNSSIDLDREHLLVQRVREPSAAAARVLL